MDKRLIYCYTSRSNEVGLAKLQPYLDKAINRVGIDNVVITTNRRGDIQILGYATLRKTLPLS